MNLIAKALLESQKKISNAQKDSANPHFKNRYASLESVIDAVKDVANANGIAIIQTGGKDSEGHFYETMLLHESGESISSRVYLVLEKQNMQGLGSPITYARRYGLAAVFAIGQDDDDGNAASAPRPIPSGSPSKVMPKPIQQPIIATAAPQDDYDSFNYGHNVNAKANTEFDPPSFKNEIPNDVVNYVIKIGKKYLGMRLGDLTFKDAEEYAKYLQRTAAEKQKPLTGDFLEFISMVEKYKSS